MNQFLSKNLLKIVATGESRIELTHGAERMLEQRRKELLPNTLKLILMSQSHELIKCTIDVFPKELLLQVMEMKAIRNLITHMNKERLGEIKTELLALIPALENDEESLITTIMYEFPKEAMEIGRNYEAMAKHLVVHPECTLDDMLTMINKFPSTLHNALYRSGQLPKMLEAGCFNLVKTGKEYKEEE